MSIFDVDYFDTIWPLLLPPDKRLPKWLAWGTTLLTGKQWKHNGFFLGYMTGAANLDIPPIDYDPSINYPKGHKVIYRLQSGGNYFGDNGVYQALYDVPIGGPAPVGSALVPDVAPPLALENTTAALAWLSNYSWVKVLDNFLGANERASYCCQTLIFEYALNRWFNTIFRQPNGIAKDHVLNPSGTSDIYITVNSNTSHQFFWGQTRSLYFFGPATNFTIGSTPLSTFFTPGNSFLLPNDYTINIPVGVYNALIYYLREPLVIAGGNSRLRDGVVMAFADQINPAGSKYNINTY